jgi:hypothetical protein
LSRSSEFVSPACAGYHQTRIPRPSRSRSPGLPEESGFAHLPGRAPPRRVAKAVNGTENGWTPHTNAGTYACAFVQLLLPDKVEKGSRCALQ